MIPLDSPWIYTKKKLVFVHRQTEEGSQREEVRKDLPGRRSRLEIVSHTIQQHTRSSNIQDARHSSRPRGVGSLRDFVPINTVSRKTTVAACSLLSDTSRISSLFSRVPRCNGLQANQGGTFWRNFRETAQGTNSCDAGEWLERMLEHVGIGSLRTAKPVLILKKDARHAGLPVDLVLCQSECLRFFRPLIPSLCLHKKLRLAILNSLQRRRSSNAMVST